MYFIVYLYFKIILFKVYFKIHYTLYTIYYKSISNNSSFRHAWTKSVTFLNFQKIV